MSRFQGIDRIIAVGDLHGNYAGFRSILIHCGIIDKRERWTGGSSHLVQLGDVLGRGGEPGKIFRLLKRLEQEAGEQGGRVHLLLGNHEAMSISGMLMYNTLEEFKDLAAEDMLEPSVEMETALRSGRLPGAGKTRFGTRLDMLGAREFRDSLAPEGKVGLWLSHHDSAVVINDYLFVHGGLNRECGRIPLDDLNERVRRELLTAGPRGEGGDTAEENPDWTAGGLLLRRDGPQWNREYTLDQSPEREKELEEVLAFHRCRAMVVGHTPTKCIDVAQAGKIIPLYGGKLQCIDTGIGRSYGGNLSALSIQGKSLTPIYP